MPIFETTTLLASLLLSILVPFFVFTTTLLGSASTRIKEEEERARGQDKKEFDERIKKVEDELRKSQESGDIKELKDKLDELIENRKKSEEHIKAIRQKYDSIKLHGVVIYPGASFLLSCILATGASVYLNDSYYLSLVLWIAALVFLAHGIRAVYIALARVQEIATASEEYRIREHSRMLEQAFSSALASHEEKKKEVLKIDFVDTTFPISSGLGKELEIPFRVRLTQGKIVRSVDIWFFVPDGFDLLEPDAFWRQAKEFTVPNIRTFKVLLGDISIGPYRPGSLKVKTPGVPGEHKMLYSIRGEGYTDEIKEFVVRVGNTENK